MGPLGSGSCLVANRADVMPANFRPTDRTDVLTYTPEQQHLVYKANIYFNCYICYWTVFTYVVFYFPYLGYNGYYFLINFCVCLLVNADCRTPAVMPAKINPVPMVFPHKSVLFLWESRDMCSHNHEKATENPWVSPVPIPMQLSTRELKTACAALHLSSVVNVFHIAIAMTSRKAQWTSGEMKMSMFAVERYCIRVWWLKKNCCKILNLFVLNM